MGHDFDFTEPGSDLYWSELSLYYKVAPASPLGAHQGCSGCIFGFPYAPGSVPDRIVEAFSGVHDFLNHMHFYNADGTSHDYLPQLGKAGSYLGEAINATNVLLAAPIVITSSTPEYMRWILTGPRCGRDEKC